MQGLPEEARAHATPVRGAIVPHAGLQYSGACAAEVFTRVQLAPTVVILAPNHTGRVGAPGGASAWIEGAFETPLGRIRIAEDFLHGLCRTCDLVSHDPVAHEREHAIEVELPFLSLLSPQSLLAPIVLAWDDWERCRVLGDALATAVREWSEPVSLLASSDMTHYETAVSAEQKDRLALDHIVRLDGAGLLAVCRRDNITMCGRAAAATVLHAAKALGATTGELVDYRHSGWVTGDESSVVAYAGVIIP